MFTDIIANGMENRNTEPLQVYKRDFIELLNVRMLLCYYNGKFL